MSTHNYDLLQNTWIYQEIKQQIQADEQKQHLNEQRQLLLAIITARFPRIITQAKPLIETGINLQLLQELLIKVGTARTEKEARQALRPYLASSAQIIATPINKRRARIKEGDKK